MTADIIGGGGGEQAVLRSVLDAVAAAFGPQREYDGDAPDVRVGVVHRSDVALAKRGDIGCDRLSGLDLHHLDTGQLELRDERDVDGIRPRLLVERRSS